MKKLLLILGGLFMIALMAIVSVPLFVNVDQYRPQITAEVNKRINGELKLGKLNLSLWGAIKIHAESVALSVNGFPGQMLEAQTFHLELPFSSVFSGRPEIVAVITAPKIFITKNEAGAMNATALMKESAEPVAAPPAVGNPAPVASPAPVATAEPTAEPTKVPALIAGAKLGLRIEKGDLRFADPLAKSEYAVRGLDLEARNIGLGSTMDIRLTAPLQGRTPSMVFEGPVEMKASLVPVLVGTSIKSAQGTIDLDATKLAIESKGQFKKAADIKFTAQVRLEGTEHETLLRQLEVDFHRYKIHGKGRLTRNPVTAKLDFNTDPMRLDQLQDFLPVVKPYELKGLLNLNATADIKPESMKINGDIKLGEGSISAREFLKAPVQFQLQAGFSETSLNLTRATVSAPDSELQLVGNVKNFLAPQFSFSLSGKSLNLDKLFADPPPVKNASLFFDLLPTAYAVENADVNPLAALAANPVMAKAIGALNVQIARVVVKGAALDQLSARAELKNMNLRLPEASLRTFGGTVRSVASFDLKSPRLTFSSQGNGREISGREAFAAYFPKYQNTLEGTVGANWNVSGALYPAAARVRSLQGTAKIAATDGALKSVDFQASINSAMQKIPFLKDKKPLEMDNGFRSLTADLKFTNGVVQADPIEVQPRGKGFVVKGKSTIQESLEQETFFDVYDPQGLLPRDIQQPGKAAIALRLTGPLTAPKTDYEYTVKRLANNAGKNAVKNVAEKALDKFLGGKGEDQDPKKDALRDAADKLRKKFKF